MNWVTWSVVLFLQNFSFTFVSRARNSGSVLRHMIAAILSNAIWFVSQLFMFTTMFDALRGNKGVSQQVWAGVVYTLLTVFGSISAHYYALRTEKGKNAVGANKKYAQITVEEWQSFKDRYVDDLK